MNTTGLASYGYAPGSYFRGSGCTTCHNDLEGVAKGAFCCQPCAVRANAAYIAALEKQPENTVAWVGKLYRHFKGQVYRVTEITKNADGSGERVTYTEAVHIGIRAWNRPRKEFEDRISDGQNRFQHIELNT